MSKDQLQFAEKKMTTTINAWYNAHTAIQSRPQYKRASYESMHTHIESFFGVPCVCVWLQMHLHLPIHMYVSICMCVAVQAWLCTNTRACWGDMCVWPSLGDGKLINKTCYPMDDSWLSWRTHTADRYEADAGKGVFHNAPQMFNDIVKTISTNIFWNGYLSAIIFV